LESDWNINTCTGIKKGEMVSCGLCGGLPDRLTYAWDDLRDPEPELPEAVRRLVRVAGWRMDASRGEELQRCPVCGAAFRWESDYEVLPRGRDSHLVLERLDAAQAETLRARLELRDKGR
jgi:uncharacterized C2H2 Zn-finger protein